jgi:HAD superfamily hydrolase (TIGR01459 family)
MIEPRVPEIEILPSIAPLAARTDAWLVDIWGVMHNGAEPYAAAVQACQRFRGGGGSVLLLSNAPRPHSSVAEQLDRIGVARSAYDRIVSSGDATRALIADLGVGTIFHLGPDRDRPIFSGLAVAISEAAETAEAIVCTGLYDDERETPDDYAALLDSCARARLPMICANPDVVVERAGRMIPCAGAVAAAYAARGGAVTYAGKPYPEIYDMALGAVAEMRGGLVERGRILAIGDGVETDIKGAATAGLAALYVASPVALRAGEALDQGSLSRLFPDPAVRPVGAMAALAW